MLSHIQRWMAVVVLVVVLATPDAMPARAQSGDELAALRAQVSRLYDQGKYADAVPIAERYVARARRKHGERHPEFALAIDWLAHVYVAQGRMPRPSRSTSAPLPSMRRHSAPTTLCLPRPS